VTRQEHLAGQTESGSEIDIIGSWVAINPPNMVDGRIFVLVGVEVEPRSGPDGIEP